MIDHFQFKKLPKGITCWYTHVDTFGKYISTRNNTLLLVSIETVEHSLSTMMSTTRICKIPGNLKLICWLLVSAFWKWCWSLHFWKTCLLPLTPPFFFRFSSGTCILHAASVCFRLHFRLSSVFLPGLRILDNWISGFRLLFRFSSVCLPGPCVFKKHVFWNSVATRFIFGHRSLISF